MGEKISRREFAKTAALAAAALSVAPTALAQQQPDYELEQTLGDIDHQLATPLSPDAKKIAREMVRANRQTTRNRLNHKLPENSEPCFLYVAQPHKEVKK